MARLEYRTISHRTVHALPVGDKDAVYWDRKLQGFGVRVYPSGSKVYVVQTRAGGKSKRVAIGRHGVNGGVIMYRRGGAKMYQEPRR